MTASPVANASRLRVVYKKHTTGVITPGTPPLPSVDPTSSGGQILRRTTSSLSLAKATFSSSEIRPDLQESDFRHGGRRVPGGIGGELSPLTYQDFFDGLLRGTWAATTPITETTYTSLTAAASTSTFTLGASTWAAAGAKVGMVFRVTNISGNNLGKNFQITALSGTAATVYPAPEDMTADTSFTITFPGRAVYAPEAGSLVIPAYFIEHYYEDIDITHEFIQNRISSCKLSLADKIATVDFTLLGRDMQRLASGSSPFFTAPTAATTTTLLTTFGGWLLAGGTPLFAVTSLDLNIDIKATGQDIAFDPYMPEIFTGPMSVTGTINGFFSDDVLPGYFDNETEFELAGMATTANTRTADFLSFFLPRVKLSGATLNNGGTAGVPISAPFTATKKATTSGYNSTTIQLQDSLSA